MRPFVSDNIALGNIFLGIMGELCCSIKDKKKTHWKIWSSNALCVFISHHVFGFLLLFFLALYSKTIYKRIKSIQ